MQGEGDGGTCAHTPVGRAVDGCAGVGRTGRVRHSGHGHGRIRVLAVHVSHGGAVVAASGRLRQQVGRVLLALLHRPRRLHGGSGPVGIVEGGGFRFLARLLCVLLGFELLELGFHELHVWHPHPPHHLVTAPYASGQSTTRHLPLAPTIVPHAHRATRSLPCACTAPRCICRTPFCCLKTQIGTADPRRPDSNKSTRALPQKTRHVETQTLYTDLSPKCKHSKTL